MKKKCSHYYIILPQQIQWSITNGSSPIPNANYYLFSETLGGTAKDTINIGSNPVAGSVSTDTYINPASSDLKRKRKEEEKERKGVESERDKKNIFRVYKMPTKDAPQYCARWPHCVYLAGISSLQENKKERTNKKRSARNT